MRLCDAVCPAVSGEPHLFRGQSHCFVWVNRSTAGLCRPHDEGFMAMPSSPQPRPEPSPQPLAPGLLRPLLQASMRALPFAQRRQNPRNTGQALPRRRRTLPTDNIARCRYGSRPRPAAAPPPPGRPAAPPPPPAVAEPPAPMPRPPLLSCRATICCQTVASFPPSACTMAASTPRTAIHATGDSPGTATASRTRSASTALTYRHPGPRLGLP